MKWLGKGDSRHYATQTQIMDINCSVFKEENVEHLTFPCQTWALDTVYKVWTVKMINGQVEM